MYQILIAEDEKDERDVVTFLLKKYGFNLNVFQAENGKEALSVLDQHKIDILFTDVRMPFLYGTDLAIYAKKLYSNIQILFFSGYDDFTYVKKALKVGAVEYILKPIHPEEFKKSIENALGKLDYQIKMQKKHKIATLYAKNHIISCLLNDLKIEDIQNDYGNLDLSFLNEFEYMYLLQFDTEAFDCKSQSFFENSISSTLKQQPFHYLNLNPCQSLVFLKYTNSTSEYLIEIAQELQKQLTNICNKSCYISISEQLKGAESIKPAYEKAEQAMDDRFFYTNIFIYPINKKTDVEEEKNHHDDSNIQLIKNAILYKDIFSLKKNINIMFDKYKEKQNQSHIYIRYIFSQIAEILCSSLPNATEKKCQELVGQIYLSKHFDEIKELVTNILNKVINKLESEQQSPKHAVCLVQEYIQNNYDKELNLEKLSEYVFLSPHYLSDLFIRETGCGINKYIKKTRMEKAKKLLINTNLKVGDICKKVGYSNISYFCRNFRENYGKAPDAYRQSKTR